MSKICECCGQVIRAKRAKAPTFRGYDDFVPAFNAARHAAIAALGERWYLVPGASMRARVPTAWVACKVFGRTSTAPRDQRFPAAQFWAGGMLPAGPDYEAVLVSADTLARLRERKAETVARVRRLLTDREARWSYEYVGAQRSVGRGIAALLEHTAKRRREIVQLNCAIRFAEAA